MARNNLLNLLVFYFILNIGCKSSREMIYISNLYSNPTQSKNEVDHTNYIQNALNRRPKMMIFEKGTYLITKPLIIHSDVIINGNDSKIILPESEPFPFFYSSKSKGIEIINFNLKGNKTNINELELRDTKQTFPIIFKQSKNIIIKNIRFDNHSTTCIYLEDVEKVNIDSCNFENIGLSTVRADNLPSYSYDGIFIGGYQESKEIFIQNCVFKDIGITKNLDNKNPPEEFKNDGDGIQVLMSKNAKANNINIENNKFINCSARGVKIQSGDKISVKNCSFRKCKSGIGLVMVENINNVIIENNVFTQCHHAISPNSSSSLIASNIIITKNTADDITLFLRTNGKSKMDKAQVNNNEVKNIKLIFADGVFNNSSFLNNKIINFAINQDKSFYMAFLIGSGSNNVSIKENTISTTVETHCAIYVQTKTNNIQIEKNNITIPRYKNTTKYIIHFSDKNNEVTKNNTFNGIELKLLKS